MGSKQKVLQISGSTTSIALAGSANRRMVRKATINMKALKIGLVVIGIVVLIGIAIAPIGPLPGVFLGGKATDVPAQWPDTSDVDEIRLRVPGFLPRVVIIWVVESTGELYVVGARDSGWVAMLGEGAPVDMRLGESTYALRAVAVREGWESVLTAYVEKYRPDYPEIIAGFPSVEEARSQVAVFRLERSAGQIGTVSAP